MKTSACRSRSSGFCPMSHALSTSSRPRLLRADGSSISARGRRGGSASSMPSNARRRTAPTPSASSASSQAALPPFSVQRKGPRMTPSSARPTSGRRTSRRRTSPSASRHQGGRPTCSVHCAMRAPSARRPSRSPAHRLPLSRKTSMSHCCPSSAPRPSRARRA